MNTSSQDTATSSTTNGEPQGSAADLLVALATTWAKHGLAVGKLALETSATTLQETAQLLGRIRTTLGRNETDETPGDAPTGK